MFGMIYSTKFILVILLNLLEYVLKKMISVDMHDNIFKNDLNNLYVLLFKNPCG